MNNTERKDYRLLLHEHMKKIYRKRIIIDKLATIFAIVCVVAPYNPTWEYPARSGEKWC